VALTLGGSKRMLAAFGAAPGKVVWVFELLRRDRQTYVQTNRQTPDQCFTLIAMKVAGLTRYTSSKKCQFFVRCMKVGVFAKNHRVWAELCRKIFGNRLQTPAWWVNWNNFSRYFRY